MKDYIIRNSIRTPDGTELISKHVHDYVSHTDKNGFTYAVDGGKEHLRRVVDHEAPDYVNTYIMLSDGHKAVREAFIWGRNYDADMNLLPQTEYVLLKDITDDHLKALIVYTKEYPEPINYIFKQELEWRIK